MDDKQDTNKDQVKALMSSTKKKFTQSKFNEAFVQPVII
jgi:hypothetical protein